MRALLPASVVFVLSLCYKLIVPSAGDRSVGPVIPFLQFVARAVNHLVDYGELVKIQAGVSAVVFALVIFIAGSLRGDEPIDRNRVLLRESDLFPLVLVALFGFVILLLPGEIPWKVLPPVVLTVLTVRSVFRLLKVLINRNLFAKKRRDLLKERMDASLDDAIKQRLGRAVVEEELILRGIKLLYSPGTPKLRVREFPARRDGVIVDIKLDRLHDFAEIVEAEANKVKLQFAPRGSPMITQNVDSDKLPADTVRRMQANNHRYLCSTVGDVVTRGTALIRVDQVLLQDDGSSRVLESRCESAFEISGEEDNVSSQVNRELLGLKRQLLSSIRSGDLDGIDDYARDYQYLARSFAECLEAYGSQEVGEVDWIVSHLREAIDCAIETGDQYVISKVAGLSTSIALVSEEWPDPLLFQRFMGSLIILYGRAVGRAERAIDVKSTVVGHLKYVCRDLDFRMRRSLTQTGSVPLVAGQLAHQAIMIYQNLIRTALQLNQLPDAVEFARAAKMAFPDDHYVVSDGVTKVKRALAAERVQMLFGISAWALDLRVSVGHSAIDDATLSALIGLLPGELPQLTLSFLEAYSRDAVDKWGWDFWTDKSKSLNWAHVDAPFEALARVYCLAALRIPRNSLSVTPDAKLDERLAEVAREGGPLLQALDEMFKREKSWDSVLTPQDASTIPSLRRLLEVAREKYESERSSKLQAAPVDPQCVNAFREEFVSSFEKAAWLWKLLRVEHDYGQPTIPGRWGISEITGKETFLNGQIEQARELGKFQGQSLGIGASDYLAGQIRGACRPAPAKTVLELLDQLPTDAVILSGNIMSFEVLQDKLNSEVPGKGREDGQSWWLEHNSRQIPVFTVSPGEARNSIAVVSRSKMGKLVQSSPLNKEDEPSNERNWFYVDVRALSQDSQATVVDDLVKNPPEWLGRIGNAEAMRRFLRERVWLQVWLRAEFMRGDDFDGVRFFLQDEKDSE